MPFYDYECKKCGHAFDELVSFAEADKVACPECKSKKTERQMPTSFGVKFTAPQDTSKWDSFTYRAGFNYEKAQGERRRAEAAAKGDQPYRNWDIAKDLNTDRNWGEVK